MPSDTTHIASSTRIDDTSPQPSVSKWTRSASNSISGDMTPRQQQQNDDAAVATTALSTQADQQHLLKSRHNSNGAASTQYSSTHRPSSSDDSFTASKSASAAQRHLRSVAHRRARYLFGLFLILCTVVLWVSSSVLIQFIFTKQQQAAAEKESEALTGQTPFALTYFNTSLFVIYLPIYALRRLFKRRRAASDAANAATIRQQQQQQSPGASSNDSEVELNGLLETQQSTSAPHTPPQQHHISALERSAIEEGVDLNDPNTEIVQEFTVMQTARIALLLSVIWFLMNYSFNLALSITSIASATILSSTSSIHVLLLTRLILHSPIRLSHVVGCLLTISGALLISYQDLLSSPHSLRGDVLAALSAVAYGAYTVALKRSVVHESQCDMSLLFGCIGGINLVALMPALPLLHYSGLEVQTIPSLSIITFLVVNALFGSVLSDLLWAKSMLLTSPLIATLGLSLTIPLAMCVDLAQHRLTFQWLYAVGALCVIAGFFIVNWMHSSDEQQDESETEANGGKRGSVLIVPQQQEDETHSGLNQV